MTTVQDVTREFSRSIIPMGAGFYMPNGSLCEYANSKQISDEKYQLEHDFYYRSKDGTLYLMRKGLTHNGASAWILKHFGSFTNSVVFHDGGYDAEIHDRLKVDALFLESMEVTDVPWYIKYTFYPSVVIGGWNVWMNHTEESITNGRKYMEIV